MGRPSTHGVCGMAASNSLQADPPRVCRACGVKAVPVLQVSLPRADGLCLCLHELLQSPDSGVLPEAHGHGRCSRAELRRLFVQVRVRAEASPSGTASVPRLLSSRDACPHESLCHQQAFRGHASLPTGLVRDLGEAALAPPDPRQLPCQTQKAGLELPVWSSLAHHLLLHSPLLVLGQSVAGSGG